MNSRNWFIDYIQLFVGTSELYRKKVNPKRLTEAVQGIDKQIKKWLTEFGMEKKIRVIPNHQGIKIHIKGKAFMEQTFYKNVDEIYLYYEKIFNIVKNWTHRESPIDPLVSRLDVACNIPLYLDTHKFVIHNPYSRKAIQYFTKDKDPKTMHKNITGIAIGNRGSDYLFLRVYDKRYDPNNLHSKLRFGSSNCTRVEYQIGRKILKEKPYNINTLGDLATSECSQITKFLQTSKNVVFFSEQELDNHKLIPSKLPSNFQEWEHAFPTSKAIITKHLNEKQQIMLGQYIKQYLPYVLHGTKK